MNAVTWMNSLSLHSSLDHTEKPSLPVGPATLLSVDQWDGGKWISRDLVWNGVKYADPTEAA